MMEFSPSYIDRLNASPLYRAVGVVMESAVDGRAVSSLAPAQSLCWPFPGQPHGGILFTQMDTTMAIAVLSKAGSGHDCVTIQFTIQYPAPARQEPFHCIASVSWATRRMSFVTGEIRDAHGVLVALGQSTFRVLDGGLSPLSEGA